MYDPSLGRWLTEDPIEYEGGDTNLYRFVANNPVLYTDPSGLELPHGRNWPGGFDPNLERFYMIPGDTPRSYHGWDAMGMLGFCRYESIWPWNTRETPEFLQFRRGCIGLNALRLGLIGGANQLSLPGLRCFCDQKSAIDNQKNHNDPSKQSVLFAIQSDKLPRDFLDWLKKPNGCKDNQCEYDISKMTMLQLGGYNFSTAIQDTNGNVQYWEWMANGIGSDPSLTVRHGRSLPHHIYPTTIYCSGEIPKHKYLPPILPAK